MFELRISIDDGHFLDLCVLRYLMAYDLNRYATFYIAPDYSSLTEDDIRTIDKHANVGGHTLNHKPIRYLDDTEAFCEVGMGKKVLENIVGHEVYSFAYPKGWYSEKDMATVRRCGFKEAVSMKLGVTNTDGYGKFELPRTAHIYPRDDYQKYGIDNSIIKLFNEARDNNGYFNLALHSWEIEKFNLWDTMETVLRYIKQNK